MCGVHFMGETAKILCPDKKVLVPDLNAGCSLADSCPADELDVYKRQVEECLRMPRLLFPKVESVAVFPIPKSVLITSP